MTEAERKLLLAVARQLREDLLRVGQDVDAGVLQDAMRAVERENQPEPVR